MWGRPPTTIEEGSRLKRSLIALALLAACLSAMAHAPAKSQALPRRPNIVVIMTDDMRFDQLSAMPEVMDEIVGEGRSFNETFATSAICCPSRMSFLRGQYVHTHTVYETIVTSDPTSPFYRYSSGVWAKKVGVDSPTIATWLHQLGYFTAESGKFLNGYPGLHPPSGWDFWRQKLGNYTNFKVVVDGKYVQYRVGDLRGRRGDRQRHRCHPRLGYPAAVPVARLLRAPFAMDAAASVQHGRQGSAV
jgi:arylsulfatase A-like enzyme